MSAPICPLYSLPVLALDGRVYHNPHCAACNGHVINQTKCAPTSHMFSLTNRVSLFTRFLFPTITYILRFHQNESLDCGQNQFYDNIYQKCYSLTCGKRYQNMGGVCIRTSRLTMANCKHVDHIQSWHVIDDFGNGTIIDIRSKRVYHDDDYDLATVDGNTVYTVCAELDSLMSEENVIYFDDIQTQLSVVLTSISLICLFLHILIYSSLKKLRQSQPSKNLLSLVCSLFIGQIFFFFGFDFQYSHSICMFVSIGSHYFLLVSFFCMNVISYDMCQTFLSPLPCTRRKRRFKVYSYYSWGIPLLIVTIATFIDRFTVPDILKVYKPNYASRICWMNNINASALFFVLPVCTLIMENFVFFIMTVYGIKKNKFQSQSSVTSRSSGNVKFVENKDQTNWTQHKNKVYFIIYLKLSILMGTTWLFAFLAAILKFHFLWYPFIIFNSLQGTFIFIFFDLKWKVYFTAYEKVVGKSHPRKAQHLRTTFMKRMKYYKNEANNDENKRLETSNNTENNEAEKNTDRG